jgi:hypothetical protein
MVNSELLNHDPGPLTQQQLKTITAPDETWSDDFALKIVKQDFSAAEIYRTNNHDSRWGVHDSLYLGNVPQKYWEGTRIPRANISVFTAYEQIESMVPRIIQALFGDDPWFDATAMGKTSANAARVAREVILAQLSESKIRKVIEIAIRSGLIYGNGPLELSWLYSSQMVKKFVPKFIPRKQKAFHPLMGMVNLPVGGYDRVIREVEEEEYINRPLLENIDIRDFYIDPNCPTSDPQDARFTVKRAYKDADWWDSFRGVEGFNVPSKEDIVEFCHQKNSAQSDNTKQWQEAARFGQWSPQVDQSVDPGAGRFELLCYKTDRRIVWIANRSYVVYNIPNPYGKKLQYNFSYTDIVSRFFGMSVCDVVEGEQRLQEGLTNARVDEIALNIHPATIVKRGNRTPVYKLRLRPGAVEESDDPKGDMIRQFTNNVTQNAYQEQQMSDIRVQKITGLADTSSGGQNPVARSATGAGLQGQATVVRNQYQVEKVEDNVLEPILRDTLMLNDHHLDPDQRIAAVDGEEIDPLEIFGANVKFKMRAGSRMASRAGLLQALPLIFQEMVNPQLQAQLTQQGLTINYVEAFQMVLDATGYRRKADWVRKLTQEEQKALQAAQENPQTAELVKQRERLSAMGEQTQTKGELSLAETALQGRIDMLIEQLKANTKDAKEKKSDAAD